MLYQEHEKPLVDNQQIPFWDDLRRQLEKLKLPNGLDARFADYLTGYLLVRSLQQTRGKSKDLDGIPQEDTWRELKRSSRLRAIGLAPALAISPSPPHAMALKTRIIGLMQDDLVKRGWSRKRSIDLYVIPVLGVLGIGADSESILRQARPSRLRKTRSKT